MNTKRILVLCSGGDAPGMNAAIRAIVRTGSYHGIDVFGARLGYIGLINQDIFKMTPDSVAHCIQRGGTILKTGRTDEFKQKTTRQTIGQFLKKSEIDGLIVLGGDGSFRGATLLSQECSLHVIGIPCTIDNDIVGTDYTIGFDTARNTALNAIDKIRDTADSHNRNFLVEVMGGKTGFLALEVGIAGGAEFILIPEVDISIASLAQRIRAPRRKKLGSIIVVAEANEPGRSVRIAEQLQHYAELEYRVCILGHTQRGGAPSAWDRQVACVMGAKAIEAILAGESNKMTAMVHGSYRLVDFPSEHQAIKTLSDTSLLTLNDILCDIPPLTTQIS